jgi:hypothetical protein
MSALLEFWRKRSVLIVNAVEYVSTRAFEISGFFESEISRFRDLNLEFIKP